MITSQIDTAPKPRRSPHGAPRRLITSQIDTAPKQLGVHGTNGLGLITSQIDTAPKLYVGAVHVKRV